MNPRIVDQVLDLSFSAGLGQAEAKEKCPADVAEDLIRQRYYGDEVAIRGWKVLFAGGHGP